MGRGAIMPIYNEIKTSNWVLRLPADWHAAPGPAQGAHFESSDGAKGLYIATHRVAPEFPGSLEELAQWFVTAELSTLQAMDGFHFDIAERSVAPAPGACVAVLECIAPAQQYRVVAKILSRPGQVVRASFHDYQCERAADSRAYFEAILASLAFVDTSARPGTLLH